MFRIRTGTSAPFDIQGYFLTLVVTSAVHAVLHIGATIGIRHYSSVNIADFLNHHAK
jgi:hypothetical protein